MSDFDMQRAADVLFGSAPAEKPAAAQPAAQEPTAADVLFGKPTAPKADAPKADAPKGDANAPAKSDEDRAAVMFTGGMNTHGDAARALTTALKDQLVAPEAAQAEVAGYVELFSTHGINASESKQLVDVAVGLARNQPDAPTTARHQQEARDALVGEFGDSAALALQDAIALTASDPRLKALAATALGNKREFVVAVARRARALRAQGKLGQRS